MERHHTPRAVEIVRLRDLWKYRSEAPPRTAATIAHGRKYYCARIALMPTVYLPNEPAPLHSSFLCSPEDLDAFLAFHGVAPASQLVVARPYCLTPLAPGARHVVSRLEAMPHTDRQALGYLINEFGDHTLALAELHERALSYLNLPQTSTLIGAGATAASVPIHRATTFQHALLDYQQALIALNEFERGKGRPASPLAQRRDASAQLRQAVIARFEVLNREFQTELKRSVPVSHAGKNRGNALNGLQRGLVLAKRRPGRGLYVADVGKASQLASMSQRVRAVGNGAVTLDAGLRINQVNNTFRGGGDWMREASVEATGFGMGGAAGGLFGRATTSVTITGAGLVAAKLGLALTPFGWAVIIGVGVGAGLYAGYQAGTAFDAAGRYVSRLVWDRG
jgi:hypothetical protein